MPNEKKLRDNTNRTLILNFLRLSRHPLKISELSKMLSISRPAVYLHLDILESRGLISRTKDNDKKGAPVFISLNEPTFKDYEEKEMIKLLKFIEENHNFDINDLPKEFDFSNTNAYVNAMLGGFLKSSISLTPKGEKFLEENDKP